MKSHLRYAGAALLVLTLAACGGGEGLVADPANPPDAPIARSEPPPAPAQLSLSYDVKTLQFTWPASQGATHYEVFQDPDGPAGPLTAALVATTAESMLPYAVALKARFAPNATFAVRACHDAACGAFSASVRPDLATTVGFLKRYQAAEFEGLGYALALSADGRTLAAGAMYDTHANAGVTSDPLADLGPETLPGAGAVVVFTRAAATGPWRQQAVIKPLNPSEGAQFGASVALAADGNTLAVGAPFERASGSGITQGAAGPVNTLAMASGAAYIFTRSGNAWSEQAYFKGDVAGPFLNYGISVALSGDGDTFAVGAPGDNRIVTENGAAYVYGRSLGTWSKTTVLLASNADLYDRFGDNIALSTDGSTLAVGATRESGSATAPLPGGVNESLVGNGALESGAVYVFARGALGAWTEQAYLKGSRSEIAVGFGQALSLSADGSTIAVGAPFDDRSQRDTAATDPNANYGAAYVFTRSGTTWTEQVYLKAASLETNASFGSRLSLSADGNTMAVASPYDSSAATGLNGDETDRSISGVGAVHLYKRVAGSWTRDAYLKPNTATQWLSFGWDVALSADGAVLAVGASGDSAPDLKTPSVNKSSSGAVYLY